jgi:hypothetical protein
MGFDAGYGPLALRPGACTSSTKPASPFDGQVIYMTDADQTAVWDGSSWVGLERSRDRNIIINGAMQVHQRGTSVAGIVGNGYNTADRWLCDASGLGTWTQSVENDGPTGSGLRKSLKMLVTTADASPASTDYFYISQRIEGQNAQVFAKGTSSAKQMTVSFWVKSNVTGTYVVRLLDADNSNRMASSQYTISSSATWEKKTITFTADTTGVLDNDANQSLWVSFWLGGGSNFTSGTTQAWGAYAAANEAPGQTNLASATNNYWQVTGVQLEAGAVATPFEFEDYGTTLQKCYRYYQRFIPNTNYGLYGFGTAPNSAAVYVNMNYLTPLRTSPSALEYLNISAQDTQNAPIAVSSMSINQSTTNNCSLLAVVSGATQYRPYTIGSNNTTNSYIGVSAEL